ncbi:MAG: putative secreted protein [Clostridiales bacterium]|jgi:thiamine biosynthesis lipoprotein|nr:putative secreted protein [Clostridiales bacterium]
MIINISACNSKKTKYEASFLVLFNTVTEVVGYTKTKDEFTKFAQLIYDNLEEYHQLYDKYHNYEGINNIKVINDNAGIKPVKVDKKVIDLLLYSKEMYNLSKGNVNIALGPVLEIWHDYRTMGVNNPQDAKLPPMSELEEAKKHTDINKIIIDESASTVFLEDEFMSLDVGAIAKGYATEQVSQIAINMGYPNFLLSVGGNVRASGSKGEKEESWNVGIQNPDQESEEGNLFILSVKDLSLVSSGNYERYYTVNGKQYHHIISPDTLMPSEYFTAVSVVCKDSGLADTLSTAIYNMPFEEGKALIDSLEDTEALWVFANGEMKYSNNFESFIKK